MPPADDEFAEFDTDEATFDAMMAESEPVELTNGPGTTVTVEQDDRAVFRLTMPSGGLLCVGTSAVSISGQAVVPEAGKLAPHHRPPAPPEALAS